MLSCDIGFCVGDVVDLFILDDLLGVEFQLFNGELLIIDFGSGFCLCSIGSD